MAADITQAVTVISSLSSGFTGLPSSPANFTVALSAGQVDLSSFGGTGGGGGGSTRPASGMLYPRGQG